MPRQIGEEKLQKFERLAERRMNEAIKKLRLIGNLANRRNYTYTDEHVRKITEALDHELRMLKARFRTESSAEDSRFSFRSR